MRIEATFSIRGGAEDTRIFEVPEEECADLPDPGSADGIFAIYDLVASRLIDAGPVMISSVRILSEEAA